MSGIEFKEGSKGFLKTQSRYKAHADIQTIQTMSIWKCRGMRMSLVKFRTRRSTF